jgi:hypothetical protein
MLKRIMSWLVKTLWMPWKKSGTWQPPDLLSTSKTYIAIIAAESEAGLSRKGTWCFA